MLALMMVPVLLLTIPGFAKQEKRVSANLLLTSMTFHGINSNAYKKMPIGARLTIGYSGTKPTWWKTNATRNITVQNLTFVDSGGKSTPIKAFAIGGARYKEARDAYQLWLTIPNFKSYKLLNNSFLRFTIIFREKNIPVTEFRKISVAIPTWVTNLTEKRQVT